VLPRHVSHAVLFSRVIRKLPLTPPPLYVRLMDQLYRSCIWTSGMAVLVMSLIIPWGVFTRYVLGTGSRWPEPVAILMMVVFTFIGAAAGYRANVHIAVGILTERLPHRLRPMFATIVNLMMVVACLFVAWYGTRLSLATMGQSIAELPWLPVGATYAWLPIGSIATLLFIIERMVYGSQEVRTATDAAGLDAGATVGPR
jgi:TRAP-type C4-dicarboxylate transport system permease small subunit